MTINSENPVFMVHRTHDMLRRREDKQALLKGLREIAQATKEKETTSVKQPATV